MSEAHSPGPEWTLTARWVFPVAGAPLERGTVTVRGGRIAAVEPHGRRTADQDLGNAALLPGLVNAHTHLDLSGLRGRCPPSADFTDWLRAVIRHRRAMTSEQVQADIRAGLTECLRFGTTLVGDISSGGLSWSALAEAPLYAVVFLELLGLPRERAAAALAAAWAWLAEHPATATCRPGLSPHAPYSVRADLFAGAARLAGDHRAPLAVHLAETQAELELLEHRRGPFVAFLTELGVWEPDGLAANPGDVMACCLAAVPRLFIHGNYLDVRLPPPRGGSVVYCPRTHAAFDHAPHPFGALLASGVNVALGTDSLASNPDLDLFAEVRYLHRRHPEVRGDVLLRTATLAGSEALGWQDETGSLEPGKSADLIVLPLPDEDATDPHRLLLESEQPVRAVLWRGGWVGNYPGK